MTDNPASVVCHDGTIESGGVLQPLFRTSDGRLLSLHGTFVRQASIGATFRICGSPMRFAPGAQASPFRVQSFQRLPIR